MVGQHLLGLGVAVLLILALVSSGCLETSKAIAQIGARQQFLDRIAALEQ
ncbi:MAG: hypothetical protein AB7S61_10370 [Methanoregulaceae archaeon]